MGPGGKGRLGTQTWFLQIAGLRGGVPQAAWGGAARGSLRHPGAPAPPPGPPKETRIGQRGKDDFRNQERALQRWEGRDFGAQSGWTGALQVDAGVLTPSWPPTAAWSAHPGARSAESGRPTGKAVTGPPSHPGHEIGLSSLPGRSLQTVLHLDKAPRPVGSCLRSRLQAGPQGCTSLRQAGRPGRGVADVLPGGAGREVQGQP